MNTINGRNIQVCACLNEIVVRADIHLKLSQPVQKFAIVGKLCSLIYCITVKLDIQFLTKVIFLLLTLIFKDDSLKMLKNGV